MTAETHERTVLYRRWSITKTQRRGWEPDGATVSAQCEEGKDPGFDVMTGMAQASIEEAQAVCDALNAQDAEKNRYQRTDQ